MDSGLTESQHYTAIFALPCCRLGVRARPRGPLESLVFLPPETPLRAPEGDDAVLIGLQQQLAAWRENPDSGFDLPLQQRGSPFQQRVWQAIAQIPRGDLRTYGALCAEVGGTARAVGQACGANPFPILVPCHRVVAKTGIGGFANARDGWLLDTKRWLLRHEGVL